MTELLQLEESWKGKLHYFISDKRGNAVELAAREKVYYAKCPRRNPISFVVNFFQSLGVFLRERPNVVISTGADTAISTCLIAKLFRRRVVFIESFCRIKGPSLSGRIMYRLADLFLVQWEENLKFFPKAEFAGSVF